MTTTEQPDKPDPGRRSNTVFWASTLCAMIVIFQVVRLAPSASNPVVGWILPLLASALWLGYYRLRGRIGRLSEITSGEAVELAGFVLQGMDAFAALAFITLLSALAAHR